MLPSSKLCAWFDGVSKQHQSSRKCFLNSTHRELREKLALEVTQLKLTNAVKHWRSDINKISLVIIQGRQTICSEQRAEL